MARFAPQERAKALSLGEKSYFTGRPCANGHVDKRQTSNGTCVTCALLKTKSYAIKNKEKLSVKRKAYYLENIEQQLEYAENYRNNNRDKIKQYNKEKFAKNPHLKAHYERLRQVSKLQATPKWLSKEHLNAIKEVYKFAKETQNLYKIRMAVDHIVPIKGKTVCGLHVPWNLCVRTASDNSVKNNKLTNEAYLPKQECILVCKSAFPWNLKKEQQNGI
jgi:hypothetical protein